MKRLLVAASAVALIATLAGCSGSATTIPTGAVAQAAPSGFVESDNIDGLPVKITIEPFQPGENSFVVTTADSGIASVETQVIMLEMGHGAILDLAPTSAGRYEVTSPVIDMDGKWMLRVKLTTSDGEEKLATFYGKIKTQQ